MTEPVEWARTEIERLRQIQGNDTAAAGPAIEFLKRMTGEDSEFTSHAKASGTSGRSNYRGNVAFARRALEQWIEFQESGGAGTVGFEARARLEAATDLMEQVELLLDDRTVHPAAPIMLAGAALEEFLRSMMHRHPEAVLEGRPGLENYAKALRRVEALSRQDGKAVTFLAGLRNDAAHGHFDDLSRDQAVLMAQQVNLFLTQHGT